MSKRKQGTKTERPHDTIGRLRRANKGLKRTNADLKQENERLTMRIEGLELANRQLLRDYDHLADMAVCTRMAALETENRRLRDAMREIAHFAVETGCVIEPSERVTGKKKE